MDTQSKNKDNQTGIFESVINAKDSEVFHEFKKTLPKRYADNIDTLKVAPSEALKKLDFFDLLDMEIYEFNNKNLPGFHKLAVVLQESSTGANIITLFKGILSNNEYTAADDRKRIAQAIILAMFIIDFSVIMTDNAWFVQETERILKENGDDDHE